MDNNKYSLDDILLEVGLSAVPEEEDKVDVDALLQNIITEKEPVEKEEAVSFTEAPTKEFTPAKRLEKAVGAQTVRRNSPSVSVPPEPDKKKVLPEPAAAAPVENSGNFSIDIEGIRQEYKMPEAPPLESPSEEMRPEPPEIHFNQKKEEPDFERRLEFAPCFKKFEEAASPEHQKDWEVFSAQRKNSFYCSGQFFAADGGGLPHPVDDDLLKRFYGDRIYPYSAVFADYRRNWSDFRCSGFSGAHKRRAVYTEIGAQPGHYANGGLCFLYGAVFYPARIPKRAV